jgi:hypothetical protein
MQTYEVTYALSNDPNATSTSGFSSSTDRNNLKMRVQAIGSNQACMMVESMNGGPARCQAKFAYPVN